MLQTFVVIGVGAVIAVVAIGFAAVHVSRQHNYQHNYDRKKKREISEPDLSGIQGPVGSCSHCDGDVSSINGYFLPCNHSIHYTCATGVKSQLRKCPDASMMCKICVGSRLKNDKKSGSHDGLRNRKRETTECVTCGKEITEKPKILKCGHGMHESCWVRVEETSTTCPGCMDEE